MLGWLTPRMVLLASLASGTGAAGAAALAVTDLADMTLEQLSRIQVTSVSRRAESLAEAAASVFVITAQDIRRSGAASLPEALRLAPNLDVARVDANQYAISARGFNNVLANRLLVMIDGRTVYSPLFSGVFWEAQDVMLEDVERIEVISGPGATMWGANAVNGVINVITRPARDTQGALAAVLGGDHDTGAALRYGGTLGAAHYRVYGKYTEREPSERASGVPVRDASHMGLLGLRADWGGGRDAFTLKAEAYEGKVDAPPGARRPSGANVLGRWARFLGADSGFVLQAYFDRTERDQPGAIREKLDTYDIEFQHDFVPLARHRLIWGGGVRHAHDRLENLNPAVLAFVPASRTLDWANLFAQDEIELGAELSAILGLKAERNPYTGTELLPGARLAWTPNPRSLAWAAWSRAVRAPSRIDRELFTPTLAGGPDFRSEVSRVLELGYRGQPSRRLSYSVSAFHHRHERLRSLRPAPAGLQFANDIEGRSRGVEGWASWRALPSWRLTAGGTYLNRRLQVRPGAVDAGGMAALGADPRSWWSLRSALDLSPRHELDVAVRRAGSRPTGVPAYTAVDARFAWLPSRELQLSLTLHNLFDRGHAEFGAPETRAEFDRAVFLKLLWRR
jgi:iron complex outermembrane recepter protein